MTGRTNKLSVSEPLLETYLKASNNKKTVDVVLLELCCYFVYSNIVRGFPAAHNTMFHVWLLITET